MKKTLHIDGMHCASCEMLITRGVEGITGVKVENISAKKGVIHLELSDSKLLTQIEQAIVEAGYKTIEKSEEEPHLHRYNFDRLLLSVAIVGVLAFIFYKLDIVQYLPSVGDQLSFGVALLMGIVASVSTCLAIVGSIVLGLNEYSDNKGGIKNHIKTNISFHAGRVGGFFLLGGILGLVGQAMAISLTTTTILTIFVGIVVLWMGLHLLHIVPNITALGFHLPKKRSNRTLTTKNPAFAPLIGAATFFLPCGFTLSMQLIAINTGSFWQGGLAMAIFALGTVPVLFALGLGSSYIKEKNFKLLHTIIGTLIVFFGIFMIMNGWRMFGGLSRLTNSTQNINQVDSNIIYERIDIGHDGLQTIPTTITLKAGGNYELIITPSENGKGCMTTLTIPSIDRRVTRVTKGVPIIYKFANIAKGKYPIVCGTMGMYQGEIVVQ